MPHNTAIYSAAYIFNDLVYFRFGHIYSSIYRKIDSLFVSHGKMSVRACVRGRGFCFYGVFVRVEGVLKVVLWFVS